MQINKKETTSREIAKNIFLHTSKTTLNNTEDLAHTLYTYTVSVPPLLGSIHQLVTKVNYRLM
jgi:hypothetical protein